MAPLGLDESVADQFTWGFLHGAGDFLVKLGIFLWFLIRGSWGFLGGARDFLVGLGISL